MSFWAIRKPARLESRDVRAPLRGCGADGCSVHWSKNRKPGTGALHGLRAAICAGVALGLVGINHVVLLIALLAAGFVD